MRRQLIYILVNLTSFESNALVKKCKECIGEFTLNLRKDAYALEKAAIEIIQVEGEHLVELSPLSMVEESSVKNAEIKKALGSKDVQNVFSILHNKMLAELDKSTHENKGDALPMVLYLTDCKNVNLDLTDMPLFEYKSNGLWFNVTNKAKEDNTRIKARILPIMVAGTYNSDGIEEINAIGIDWGNLSLPEKLEEPLPLYKM